MRFDKIRSYAKINISLGVLKKLKTKHHKIESLVSLIDLYDQIFIKPSKSFGIFLWKKIDGLIIDKFGPDGISNLVKLFSFKAVKFQSGYIYQYAFIMLLGFSILLTLLIVK